MDFRLPHSLYELHMARLQALDIPRWRPLLAALQKNVSEESARALMPWKKGPFEFAGFQIDAEWDCRRKWQRLAPHLPDLTQKLVLDIGCGNGWYMRQLRLQGAARVIGFDPAAIPYIQWQFTQKAWPDAQQEFYLLGVEELAQFKKTFDVILHMGVLYHHRDPLMQLVDLREALTPGGELYLETIGIAGDDNRILLPPERYASMPNVWFLPTLKGLVTMLERARFTDIEVLATHWDGVEEQRATVWSPGPSHEGSLDPQDSTRTIEGHPAPERFLVRAKSKVLA